MDVLSMNEICDLFSTVTTLYAVAQVYVFLALWTNMNSST